MIRKHIIVLSVFLTALLAVTAPAAVSAADFQTRSVDVETAVHHVDVQSRDVTAEYAAGLHGKSRADGDHLFLDYGGGPDYDYAMDMIVTADGGSVVAGYSWNSAGNFFDAHLMRHDAEGDLVWASALNLGGNDFYTAVCELPDGTFVAVGKTEVLGEEEPRVLLVRYNTNGTIQWTRLAGSSAAIYPAGICLTTDDTLAVGAHGSGYGPGSVDVLLLEFDFTGDLIQTTVVGDSSNDILRSFSATSDGGFIATGWSSSFATHAQGLLIKFADTTTVSWTTVVGDDVGYSYLFDAVEAPNGDFFASGATQDYDPSGTKDVLVARFGANGTLYWARSLGDAGVDESGETLALREGGGFMVCGDSDDGGVLEDVLLIDFDDVGGLQWVRILGDDGFERAGQVHNRPGGGYLLAGTRTPFGTGEQDTILAAVDANGQVPGCPHIRTWDTYSPLQTPAWSAVTLAVSPVTLGEQAYTTTAVNPYFYWDSLCDYEPLDPEYWLVASGRDDPDWADAIGQTPDQGYLVATQSWVGIYNTDVLLLKYDALGDLEWAREAGGMYDEIPRDLLVTDDGGCIVVGYTSTYGAGLDDALMMRFDSGGAVLWTSVTGGTQFDRLWSIHRKSDGNYLAVGNTDSYGEGLFDLLAVELTSAGTVPSVRTLGTAQNEVGLRGIALSGGGSVIAGYSNPDGGDQDAIAVRMEDDGSFTWCSQSGSAGVDRFYGIVELSGGDLLLGGHTNSYGDTDILLVKLAGNGTRQWFRTAETSNYESLYDLKPTGDGDVVGCGRISQVRGATNDALLCRFDSEGQALWAHRIGSGGEDNFEALVVHEDGFAAAGSTTSFGSSSVQAFVAHTDRDGMVRNCYLFSSETLITSDQDPPGGGYTMTSTAISPPAENPFMENWGMEPSHLELCHALPPTISATITSVPSVGTVPFSTLMSISLVNNHSEQTRRMAARIDVVLANKSYFPNWRAGYTNLSPGENYTTSWMQNIPALATVIGENRFRLVAEDVTPPPYNFPPVRAGG